MEEGGASGSPFSVIAAVFQKHSESADTVRKKHDSGEQAGNPFKPVTAKLSAVLH